MAPAAKDTSKKDGKKGDAKAKDSVEKEPSVELTEEEQLERQEGRRRDDGRERLRSATARATEAAEAGKRRASVSRFMYVGKLAEGATDEDCLAQTKGRGGRAGRGHRG